MRHTYTKLYDEQIPYIQHTYNNTLILSAQLINILSIHVRARKRMNALSKNIIVRLDFNKLNTSSLNLNMKNLFKQRFD